MQRNIYLWSKTDIQGMKNTVLNLCNAFLENNSVSTNIDALWEQFKAVCSEYLNHVPRI